MSEPARDPTTDPERRAFFEIPPESHFPIQNLPYGVFRRTGMGGVHVGVAIGEFVLDLTILEAMDVFTAPAIRDTRPFGTRSLNAFMSLGSEVWRTVRESVSDLLAGINPTLEANSSLQEQSLVPLDEVTLLMPVAVGDYTDFYSSREHAVNVGTMFRGADNALMPNWLHLPVAYHGRASSLVISGTPIPRPRGQMRKGDEPPSFGLTRRLDFELEVGVIIGPGNRLGAPVSVDDVDQHVFGMVLVNDWSARDIQQWEYVPLGPFLGKNFATTISPWVVPMQALEPFRCEAPAQNPRPLEYLRERRRSTFDINLEVAIQTGGSGEETLISRSNFRHLYWTIDQQVAHHTINGCNLRPGDLLASGTISGPDPDSYGSLLELTWNGARPLTLPDGDDRSFLEDGDTVVLTGWAEGDGYRIGFGECRGTVHPPA